VTLIWTTPLSHKRLASSRFISRDGASLRLFQRIKPQAGATAVDKGRKQGISC